MKQKIIVITGCSKEKGVGYNLANILLKRDHKVIATVRNIEKSNLQRNNCANPENLDLKYLDLYEQSSIDNFIQKVLSKYGYIDVLVNNAAEVMVGAVETATQQDLQTTYQTKVFGPVALIQGFLPSMRKRKQGLITTTSSIFCSMPFTPPGISIYFSALQAYERIQEALAIELAPWNIDVVNFQPGPIMTSLAKHEGARNDDIKALYKNFRELAHTWYKEKTEWQSAKEVAEVFANVIETDKPDLNYQSNEFGMNFVKQYRHDPTGNSYKNEWLEYFKALPLMTNDSWHIS